MGTIKATWAKRRTDSMRDLRLDEPTLLAALIVLLFAVATGAMVVGELMVAGLLFFVATFVIYLREVRT